MDLLQRYTARCVGSINVITKNDIIEDTVNLSIGSYNARKIDFNTGSKIDENSAISFSASAATSDTFRDAADYENQNFIVNYKNKITDMIINLDLFLSFKEQDLPGLVLKEVRYIITTFVTVMRIVEQQNTLVGLLLQMATPATQIKEMITPKQKICVLMQTLSTPLMN